jgi:hypothetical protein
VRLTPVVRNSAACTTVTVQTTRPTEVNKYAVRVVHNAQMYVAVTALYTSLYSIYSDSAPYTHCRCICICTQGVHEFVPHVHNTEKESEGGDKESDKEREREGQRERARPRGLPLTISH